MPMQTLAALNLTREEFFIVLCCRQMASVEPITAINDLAAQDLDWTFIEALIQLHGITGIVKNALAQGQALHNIPSGMLKNLKLAARQTTFKNILYQREFSAVVKACNSKHIKIIPLKGIAFLTSLYEHNTSIRALSDIDILVEKKNIKNIENTLLSMGYQHIQTSTRDRHRAFHSSYRRQLSGFTILIEVHWDLDYADSCYSINIDECWQRIHKSQNDVDTWYEFSKEDTLIFNCFHILRNVNKGPKFLMYLKNLCDISIMIKQWRDDIDWASIVRFSREFKVLRPVGLVLHIVQELFDLAEIPPTIFKTLRTEGFENDFALCAVKECIFTSKNCEEKIVPFWLTELKTASGMRGKIKVIFDIPHIVANLFKAIYYRRQDRSVMRTIARIIWHYIKKTVRTLRLWLFSPDTTRQLQKKMVGRNIKTGEMINWLRG